MTFSMVLRTLFEILLFVLVVWGFFHEDRLAAFERRVFCALKRRRLRVVRTQTPCRKAEYTR
ncbi:MAG: hypothetical protein U0K18_03275 [Acutalibacteraceae bacterium]|nr:hypothetical protein [Clostridia bacterium]MEE1330209.1 hypothetical protein [Acutalibacteraceae bacterium]